MFIHAEVEKGLETTAQQYKRRRYNDMYVPRDVILSEAVRKLTGTAWLVYMLFLNKRVMKPFQCKAARRAGKGKYYVENDGQIKFTYIEAKEKYGISESAFRDAIDLLIEVGLLDIAQHGSGLQGDKSLYAPSERWWLYGTPNFIVKTRPRRREHYGFVKGNRLGRHAQQEKFQHAFSTVEQL